MALLDTRIKQVQLEAGEYEIAARKILTLAGVEKSWEDIEALVEQSFQILVSKDAATTPVGVVWTDEGGQKITGTLTAAAADHNAMYLVPQDDVRTGVFVEYVAAGDPVAWEKIGTTKTDLKDYAKVGTYTSSENGSHQHEATVEVDTYEANTQKKLDVDRSQDVSLVPTEAQFVNGVEVESTVDVIGKDATIAITDAGATMSKLVVGKVIPAKANGQASKVTIGTNAGAATKVTRNSGAKTVAKVDGSITAANGQLQDASAGASSLMASAVVTNGVLSFGYKSLKTESIPKAVDETIDTFSLADVDIPTVSKVDVDVATVDAEVTVATGGIATNGEGASVAIGHGAITAAFDNKDIKAPVLSLDVDKDNALTEVAIGNQPEFELDGNAASGVGYIDGIHTGTPATKDVSVVANGAHTHNTTITNND